MAVLRVITAYAYSEPNGVQRVLRAGDLVDAKDPGVKGKPAEWFETVEANVERTTIRQEVKAAPVEPVEPTAGEERLANANALAEAARDEANADQAARDEAETQPEPEPEPAKRGPGRPRKHR